jgi:hypothetical protein
MICGPANPRAAAPSAMIAPVTLLLICSLRDLAGGLGAGRVGRKADGHAEASRRVAGWCIYRLSPECRVNITGCEIWFYFICAAMKASARCCASCVAS